MENDFSPEERCHMCRRNTRRESIILSSVFWLGSERES